MECIGRSFKRISHEHSQRVCLNVMLSCYALCLLLFGSEDVSRRVVLDNAFYG